MDMLSYYPTILFLFALPSCLLHVVVFSVAMVSYSSGAVIRFDFSASFDKATIQQMLLNAAYQAAGTATGAALNLARTQLLANTARGHRLGVNTVVILVTDGQTQEKSMVLANAATAMKGVANVEVFAVGVGNNINVGELNVIASDPISTHVFTVDFSSLLSSQLSVLLASSTCLTTTFAPVVVATTTALPVIVTTVAPIVTLTQSSSQCLSSPYF